MSDKELIPRLFRKEFSRIVAVLCKHFGFEHLEATEDIAGDTFLEALSSWPYNGIPNNPTAWLYTVARNKAINHFKRKQVFKGKVMPHLLSTSSLAEVPEIDLSEKNIYDSQLRMLFAICDPAISAPSQVCLALRVLCGFGIEEVATAFVSNKETINKRLTRAREKLRLQKSTLDFPREEELGRRLGSVLTTIYLLFNEGYYSETRNEVIREDLCFEAMSLAYLLTNNNKTDLPSVNALLALMCFHASRFAARKNKFGEIILYDEQDQNLWDWELIAKGVEFFHKSAEGDNLSPYHLEAGIAFLHTRKEDRPDKWQNILKLYDQLLVLNYTAVAALNRIYALSKAKGKAAAIPEAEKLDLAGNHFYFTLLGELYKEIDPAKCAAYFRTALSLAKTNTEKRVVMKLTSKTPSSL